MLLNGYVVVFTPRHSAADEKSEINSEEHQKDVLSRRHVDVATVDV